jgi:BirA family biotin operon repressor/biotin-[acetyl-CoA-carboxylase] ligase
MDQFPLSSATITTLLTTVRFGRSLHCFEEVDSTNTVARDLARQGAAEGTVVIAEGQTRGRGRLGRSWVSPPGRNLYLSIVVRPDLPDALLPGLSIVAGVAACEAVREWWQATIKWPNDVLVDGRKVAGLLIEAEGEGAGRFLILGIGVNLNAGAEDFPPELRDKAGSIRMATGAFVDRARFTARLLEHLERRYDQIRTEGLASIRAAWEELSDMIGREIRVDEPGGRVTGIVLGLDDDGALRLRLASGAEHRVVAGDVTVADGYGRS